ncbi:MAG TPA: M56 family metallopeptidase [Terracidiphilus sp.]|jgi:beta-lactamase regulating signal transducer with metallopeptidase domain|nr:M56 family metallopeptidase [Terracidiphilus sp.]
MMDFAPMLTSLSGGAASALIAAIWQGALLAALVWVVLRLLPGLSAAARSVVWLNVFVLMALLHLIPLFAGAQEAGQAAAEHQVRLDPRWSLLIASAWLVLSVLRAGLLVTGAFHLRRLRRRAKPTDLSPELAALLEHHGRLVQLCTSDEVARPSVLGFFRPRILIPPGVLERLTPAELRQVILHEMEHLRRGDDWTNLIQKMALVLFPLNPALAWVERRLCAERELACDDRVLRAGSGRKAYALCLAHLAEYSLVRRGFGLVLGAWERRPELVRRVQRILREPIGTMGRKAALAATGGVVAGALGCALGLAHAPEMVSFAPPQLTRAQMAASLDVAQVGRALGGTPRMVKAELPAAAAREIPVAMAHQASSHPVRPALMRRRAHPAPPASRLANLRTPPQSRTLLVMTQWTDVNERAHLVVAFAQAPDAAAPDLTPVGGANQSPAAVHPSYAIRATYAVVRTPLGWLVIQI